jgi:hypothetical protein
MEGWVSVWCVCVCVCGKRETGRQGTDLGVVIVEGGLVVEERDDDHLEHVLLQHARHDLLLLLRRGRRGLLPVRVLVDWEWAR